MRLRTVVGGAWLLIVSACGGSSSTAPTASGSNVVQATVGFVFSPSTLTISRGSSVTFTFFSVTHNVTFAGTAGAPANVAASSNTSVVRQFDTAGTFPYSCTIHGMMGSITVTP